MNLKKIAHDLVSGTLAFVVILAASLLLRATLFAGKREPTDLGPSTYSSGIATGMNDRGRFVGFQTSKSGRRGVFWNGSRSQTPSAAEFFFSLSDVNNRDQFAGSVELFGFPRAAVLDDRGLPLLVDPGGIASYAYAINDQGVAVGCYWLDANDVRGFRWSAEDGVVDLFELTGGTAVAFAKGINDRGAIVGQLAPSEGGHAFVWTPGFGVRRLERGSATYSCANAINNLGLVVGHIEFEGRTHACLWDQADELIDLNTLLPAGSRWELSAAWAINSRGQVLGNGLKNGRYRDFLFELESIRSETDSSKSRIAVRAIPLGDHGGEMAAEPQRDLQSG